VYPHLTSVVLCAVGAWIACGLDEKGPPQAMPAKGYVHVYTGNGKGKTTAALGLALRAAGAGWKVFIAQFGKGMASSELESLGRFRDLITVHRYGHPQSQASIAVCNERDAAEHGLAECKEALVSGEYSLVILDEANLGPTLRLFSVHRLIELLDARAPAVELVITGRYAHPSVLERADLVTEMRELKHYYQQGVPARTGIEQ
jgi:cob(I)alamin adenosyltransferase